MNQHYVPRVYLKNFAEKKGKEFFVSVYDKQENRFFKTNIKNICSEVDLYTLEEGNGIAKDLFTIEKVYANGIEPLYSIAYDLLSNHKVYHISDRQRVEILISIFQFYLRNPKLMRRAIAYHTNEVKRLSSEAKSASKKGITYLGEDFSFKDVRDEDIIEVFKKKVTKEYKEKHIGGIGELGNFHEFAKFEIAVARGDAEFITSDNPLVFRDLIDDNEHPLTRSKEFIVALNKKVALRLFHDNRRNLNFIYRCDMPNGSVASINNLILEQSSRFVIASETTIKETKRINEILENNSLEAKIDLLRQVVSMFGNDSQNANSIEMMRYYLEKYDSQGGLNEDEEYEMHVKIKQDGIDFTKRIIE